MPYAIVASITVFAIALFIAIRSNQPGWVLVGVAPFMFIIGWGTFRDVQAANVYTVQVQASLERDYGATVSPASVDKLPYENAKRSRGQVLLTTPTGKKLCTVETGAHGPRDLSVICAGAELPKLSAQTHP